MYNINVNFTIWLKEILLYLYIIDITYKTFFYYFLHILFIKKGIFTGAILEHLRVKI